MSGIHIPMILLITLLKKKKKKIVALDISADFYDFKYTVYEYIDESTKLADWLWFL